MLKKDFKVRQETIKSLLESDRQDGVAEYGQLVEELFEEKQYSLIVQLFDSKFIDPKSDFFSFEVAFALNEQGRKADAKAVYEHLREEDPDNPSILNNLSNLCKEFGDVERAWQLIQKAQEAAAGDEIIERNFRNLAVQIQEKEETEALFKSAVDQLEKENEFVISKLSNFVTNARKDDNYRSGVIPIPRWKLKVLMGTDDQKANSLIDQWVRKGYVRKTGERGQFNELVYEINPHLAKTIASLKPKTLNTKWIDALTKLDVATLEGLGYFEATAKISKVKKSIRSGLERDIDELFINHILQNAKSVVVLSGSVVELLLIYYLEKKKIKSVSYQLGSRTVNKKLYECDLSDLLTFCETNGHLKDVIVNLGNISRFNRNYIHPGKELRESDSLDANKANLCFSATLEILRAVT